MQNLILVLSSGVVIKLLDIAWDYYKNRKNPLNEAVCSLLRDRILHLCEKYIQNGQITHRQWESLYDLFEKYQKLGGNGFIKDEIETVSELPRV